MSYPYRRNVTLSFGGPLTPGVKVIILTTVGAFLLHELIPSLKGALALYPPAVIPGLQIWRLATWLFVHGGIMHILFNMLFLFMFGCQLERLWGTRFFVHYYFLCGIGAGLFTFIPFADFYNAYHIGASGAIYAVLMAYGLFFPRNVIYFMLMFPIEARYFVIILGLIAFWGSLQGAGSGVSHVAHLGGLAVGYVILRWAGARRRGSRDLVGTFKETYRRWRLKRLRRKFEHYYEQRTNGNDSRYKYH